MIAASLTVGAIGYAPGCRCLQLPRRSIPVRAGAAVGRRARAVICTAIAFLVFFELIAEVGPVRATVITYVNPAVAAVLGVTLLGESFTLGMGVGFVLVLAGSVLA